MQATITLDDVHSQAVKFRKQARLRRLQVWTALPFVLIVLWRMPKMTSWIMQVGGLLVLVGLIFAFWRWLRINSVNWSPEQGEPLVKAYRDSLIRLRDARRTLLLWCVTPLMPGMVLLFWGSWTQLDVTGPMALVHQRFLLMIVLFCVLAIVAGYVLNRRAAAKLQRKIDQL